MPVCPARQSDVPFVTAAPVGAGPAAWHDVAATTAGRCADAGTVRPHRRRQQEARRVVLAIVS
ncbi:hypothetical protein CCS01_09155 [Rhodopila globiformis]|uniref:Uncharacterized protein n=1 Tax=Rhodopila globiformis TaxID=1071 RepID=A0A2S6NJI2_RHOGL|nr:hypothetical protein CCS01_09155 [Rhodopila globiformis]